MTDERKMELEDFALAGTATSDYRFSFLDQPIRQNDPTGIVFNFAPFELTGHHWVTTLENFRVEIRASDPASVEVEWSALVCSPVSADRYNESVADVVWFLCLCCDGVPLPLAYFSDSFPRRCGTHVEGRCVVYTRDDRQDGWAWESGADIVRQLEVCNGALGKFVHALTATPCQ